MRMKKISKGQTMIEAVVAVGMLLFTVYAMSQLSLVSIRGGMFSKNQLLATQLAREAIEVIRSKRDANWLNRQSHPASRIKFDEGVNLGQEFLQVSFNLDAYIRKESNLWTLKELSDGSNCVQTTCLMYRDPQTGIFSHSPSGEKTIFSRYVQINEICEDHSRKQNGNSCKNPNIGIHILSTVAWNEGENDRQIQLEEWLYDSR